MTDRDAGFAAQPEPKRLRFDRYVLDLHRGCLLLDGTETALRPKTFAVLRHLAENSGRLVSKDELFAAVWPNLAITDDALVQSIGELRRALGDDGPRLIRTIPRRGYRLEAAVSVMVPTDPSPTAGTPAPPILDGEARSSVLTIRNHALTLFRTALTDWRGASLAVLALVVLLAAGTLWTIRGTVDSGDQPRKSAELGTKAAIAVLPFLNQSNDPARDYFADGVTQDIINALGRFSALTVMSWNAVLPYKGRPSGPGEIGRKLAVRYQVEGSVRHAGDRVRVAAQLVDTDGWVLWSVRSDEALADVFTVQDKITTEIAGVLAIRVNGVRATAGLRQTDREPGGLRSGTAGATGLSAPDAGE